MRFTPEVLRFVAKLHPENKRQLKQALKEYKKLKAEEKHVSFPSPLEVNHWMQIFNEKK